MKDTNKDNNILSANNFNELKPTYQNKQYATDYLNYPTFIKKVCSQLKIFSHTST